MNCQHSKSVWIFVAIACLGLGASAQVLPGDVIVADWQATGPAWRLWGITPQGNLYTLTSGLPFCAYGLAPAPDNRSVWISGSAGGTYYLASMAPSGAITTLHVDQKNLFASIDVDGAGTAILGNNAWLEILAYRNGQFTTLAAKNYQSGVAGGGLDLASGDLVFEDYAAVGLYRCQLRPPTTITSVLSIQRPAGLVGVHDDPETGDLVCCWMYYRTTNGEVDFLRLGPPSLLKPILTGVPLGQLGALDRDPRDGLYVIPSMDQNTPQNAAVFRLDARTGSITSIIRFPVTAAANPHAVTVAGSRHLCGVSEPKPGTSYDLLVSAPTKPGAPYVVAASFGFRPGLQVGGGRKVFLNPDALFFYSLLNTGIFQGFQGTLNARGEGVASMWIPPIPGLTGFRFFAAAVTIQNGAINTISEPLGITIE